MEPHFRCCCSIWGSCGKTEIGRLEKLRNCAALIVTNSNYSAPMQSLGWETIDDLINQEIKATTFKAVSNLAPQYLIDLFTEKLPCPFFIPIHLEILILIYGCQRKKRQKGRNASCREALKFGVVYDCKQNRHLPQVALNLFAVVG